MSIADLQREATKKLPVMYREYFNDGATDMIRYVPVHGCWNSLSEPISIYSLRDNTAAYDRYKLRPRVLVKIPKIDTSTTIFGSKVTFPLGFCPTALHQLAHPDGETATSRAAANMGVAMGLSSYATTPLEKVAEQGTGQNPYAIQLTIPKERHIAVQMIRRAEGVPCALFLPQTKDRLLTLRSGRVQGHLPDSRLPDPGNQT